MSKQNVMAVVYGLAFLVATISANLAAGASASFQTEFSGSTIDPALTVSAPGTTGVSLDGAGHVEVFTGPETPPAAKNADIWGTTLNGPTVRYSVDPTDGRNFVLETVLTNYYDAGVTDNQGGLIMRFSDRTIMWGPYRGVEIKYESNVGSRVAVDVPDPDIRSIGGADVNLGLRVVRDGAAYKLYYKRDSDVAGASPADADWQLFYTEPVYPGRTTNGPEWVGVFSKTWNNTVSNASFDSLSFTVTGASRPAIRWDFQDAAAQPSLDGWTVVSQSNGATNVPFLQVAASEANRMPTQPCLTTAWDVNGPANGFRGDNGHNILIARSPSFAIEAEGEITWVSVGGSFASVAPGTGTGAYPAGAIGVSLVREGDGYRILSMRTAQEGTLTYYAMDVSAFMGDGNLYYLEAVDNFSGGWGYVEWDNFSVPIPEPTTMALLGLTAAGLGGYLRRRRTCA